MVFADQRFVVRFGGIADLCDQLVAKGDGLLHQLENFLLLRRLEGNGHIAVENHLFQTIVDLLLQLS